MLLLIKLATIALAIYITINVFALTLGFVAGIITFKKQREIRKAQIALDKCK